MLADTTWDLEFRGLTGSAWWAAVALVSGAALIMYAIMLLRESRGARVAAAVRSGHSGDKVVNPAYQPPAVFGVPAGLLAALVGSSTIIFTAIFIFSGLAPHLGALLWTIAAALLAIGLLYHRVFRYLTRGRTLALLGLRAAGVLALLTLLFEPVFGFSQRSDERPKLAIVVDASGSMSTYDQPNEPHRYRQAALAVENSLAPKLAQLYDVQIFAYDGKHTEALSQPGDLDQIQPDGTVTDLGAALSLAAGQGAQRVVLFSDGINNGPQSIPAIVAATSAQIFTVKVGSSNFDQSTVPDIAVTNIDGPQTATVNNQVSLTAAIKSTALSDRTVRVMLKTSGADAVLDEQRLVLHSGPQPQTIALKFTPEKIGRMSVRVEVPVDPGERNEANNHQDFPLLVTDPKLSVLYVEGRVRPEVGPLRRALEQDPNINATSMVQVQAGHFNLSGVKPGDDLKGLPTTLAQWKRFRVIVLGDLDASFLNAQQQRDLAQAVRDGAGLLMIGGQNSFAPGKWGTTVLADLLPVSLEPTDPPQINAPFVAKLTAAGAAHPIFKGIADYFIQPDGRTNAMQMPPLSGCVALAGAKPGAVVLAVHPSANIAGQPAVVLAVQQYGQARTAAFAADTTWQWQLALRGMGKDSPYNRFWGQMIRWLAGQEDLQKKSGPSVTALVPKERYDAGEAVILRCAVTDKEGQSTAFAKVDAAVTGPDGKVTRVPLAAVSQQVGAYEGRFEPKLAGSYEVIFSATKDDTSLGQDKSGFTVMQAAQEMDVLAANPQALELLAANGGGYQELSGEAMNDLADRLVQLVDPRQQATHTTIPLYHTRGFFLLFILALGTEWFLRRRWQLQ